MSKLKNRSWSKQTLQLILCIFFFLGGSPKAEINKYQASPINESKKVWEEIIEQRNRLEESAQKIGKPLREVLEKEEFLNNFPLLPFGKQVDSILIKENIEVRIATIPLNLKRTGQPYSIVAMLYLDKESGNKTLSKIIPDTIESKRILNMTSDYNNAKKVDDMPKIINK